MRNAPGRLLAVLVATVAVLAAAAAPAPAQSGQPWKNTRLSPDQRATLLADAMTMEQKLRLFEANPSSPSPELGIPSRKEKDGCCGLGWNPATGLERTSLPKSESLASTFNESLANQYGRQIGQEAWQSGVAGVTAPTADLVRSPHFGRRGESFGEDPLLGGRLPAEVVKGVQRQRGVYSLAKHYIGNYQETSRFGANSVIDERALRELYGRQWEIIVREGNPGAVMCAFQSVNNEFACDNEHLLLDMLKGDWRFPGWVSSDFNACPDLSAFANGTEICAPNINLTPPLNARQAVERALETGVISQERFNEMVHRILRTFFARGVIDNPPPGTLETPSRDVPGGRIDEATLDRGEQLARTVGQQGTVLLKNQGGMLPLDPSDSVALIGPDADRYIDMFGSPHVPLPARLTTILEGLEERATGVVEYAEGGDTTRYGDTLGGPAPIPSSVLTPAGGSTGDRGVRATYYVGFRGPNPQGPPLLQRVEDQVNHRSGTGALIALFGLNPSPAPLLPLQAVVAPFTGVWETTLRPVETGTYNLGVRGMGTFTLYINGQPHVTQEKVGLNNYLQPIQLQAGQSYDIRLVYQSDTPGQCCGTSVPGPTVRLAWEPPSAQASPQIQEAVEAAENADVAVVVASTLEGEAVDLHSLELPQDQNRLIRAVRAANPNTVVVLTTGGAVTMPWIDEVPAVLEAWFPGEAQGKVVADVLYGDVNPSGKLPVTFPATEGQFEAISVENPSLQFALPRPTTVFDESIFVGYRGFEERGVEPLFDFGHGLSYTRFQYSRMSVANPRLTTPSRRGQDGYVRVLVRNTGQRRGTEVVQLYHGELPAQVDTPPKQLLGWGRVTLQPGRQQYVTIPVRLNTPEHQLAYWSGGEDGQWVTPRGDVPVYVGSSSDDIRQQGTLTVR